MNPNASYGTLPVFLQKLRSAKIHFTMASHREDIVMVQISVPGERWEVEFFPDGTVEVERFKSDGSLEDERALEVLFREFSE